MEQLIQANKKIDILMELWPKGLQNSGTRPEELFSWLVEHGFSLYLCTRNSRMKISRYRDVERLIPLRGYINLFATRD
jgi:hypothetical protein